MKTIGIVGTRRRDSGLDKKKAHDAFMEIYEKGDRIVSGGCAKGGDRFADQFARSLGLTIITHYPNWSKGKAAGFMRNTDIARDCDVLIAVVSPDRSGGTEDTIKKTKKLGKKVILV